MAKKYFVRKSKNLYADFETTAYEQYLREGETRVYLGGFINDTAKKPTFFGSVGGFFKALIPETLGYTNLNIFFHNLAFDSAFIIWYLNDIGYEHYVRPKGEYNLPKNTYDLFINMQGQIYSVTFQFNGCTITLKDSLKKLPTNIKALGKLVGIPKLDETHDYTEMKPVYNCIEEVPQEELDYLANDIYILRKAIQTYDDDVNFRETLTSASASYNTWLEMYFKDAKDSGRYYKQVQAKKDRLSEILPRIEDSDIQDIVNKSYRGGITYCNPKYQDKEVHGVSYDVNSLYPYSMVNRPYPCGQPKYVEKYDTNELQLITFFTFECQCTDTIPFIPTKQIGKSYEYNQTLKPGIYTLWNEEFELFKKHYNSNYQIISIVQFEKISGLFDEYIQKFAWIKATTTDPAERYITKIRLNGLGGKFGTKTWQIKKRCTGNNNQLGGLSFELCKPEEGEYYYRPISSYMTSQARCLLINAITPNFDRFIYCDTDSMYLQGYDEAVGIRIDNAELGAFKKEHTFERGRFLHTKCYVIQDNGELLHSIAGCSANAKKQITLDNFRTGLTIPKANLKALRVKGGVVLAPTDFTISSE